MKEKELSFKNRLIELLEKRVELDDNGEPILDHRVLGKKYTYLDLVLLSQIKKAICGDNSSASFIRDTSGNKLKDKSSDVKQCTISTNQLHATAVEEIIPYIDMLDDYCEIENARLIKRIRTRILAKVGLKYESCFDEDGTVKELKIDTSATKKQQRVLKKAYKRAVFVKIKHLSASALTSDGVEYDNPYDFGRSKRDFSKGKGVYDALARIIMAVIFGYFGVSLVSEINLALIIWNTLQIIMYITGGVIGMYSAYMFIVDDYRMSIIKKIDQLQRFKLYALDKGQK